LLLFLFFTLCSNTKGEISLPERLEVGNIPILTGAKFGGVVSSWFVSRKSFWNMSLDANSETVSSVAISLDSTGNEMAVFNRRILAVGFQRSLLFQDRTGLFYLRKNDSITKKILVLPRLRDYPAIHSHMRTDGGDGKEDLSGRAAGDLTDSRNYQMGDSARRIIWSVVARMGGLEQAGNKVLVRTEERVTNPKVAIFFLAGGSNDENAASFARASIEKGLLGKDWIFGASGTGAKSFENNCEKALEALAATGTRTCITDGINDLKSFSATVAKAGICNLSIIADAEVVRTGEGILEKIRAAHPLGKTARIHLCPSDDQTDDSFIADPMVAVIKPLAKI
jgi:hypothetical protein